MYTFELLAIKFAFIFDVRQVFIKQIKQCKIPMFCQYVLCAMYILTRMCRILLPSMTCVDKVL